MLCQSALPSFDEISKSGKREELTWLGLWESKQSGAGFDKALLDFTSSWQQNKCVFACSLYVFRKPHLRHPEGHIKLAACDWVTVLVFCFL